MQAMLTRSEKMLSPLDIEKVLSSLNLIQEGISVFDSDLRLVVGNSRLRDLFDLPIELTTRGAAFADLIRYMAERGEYGPGDPDDITEERIQLARAFQPHYFERTRPNGTTISVEGHPLRQGGWVTVYTDITDIKAKERLLRARSESLSEQLLNHSEDLATANRALSRTIANLEETERALRESESRARLVTQMTPAHIAYVGLDEIYTYSNKQLHRILKTPPDDIVGRSMHDVLGPTTYARIADDLERARGGESRTLEFSIDDGHEWVRLALTPDIDDTGHVRGLYLLSVLITSEVQARHRLMHAHRRELAAQITSGLAHDFANLLTIIMGQQGQLARLDDLPSQARDMIKATQDAARRGGDLIERIGRISGKRTLSPEPVDLVEVMGHLTLLAGPALPAEITLTTDVTPDLERCRLDQGFLLDALLNLIFNARDAIGNNVGDISIKARSSDQNRLTIKVEDTGPGFTDTALSRGIEPFYTTKSGAPGSGLGLATVFDFTRQSGGRLRLSNRSEGGARVTMSLTYQVETRDLTDRLILLVEDDAALREGVRDMLTDAGHRVIEAESAEEAITLLQSLSSIELVVSDLNLSGVATGATLAEWLAKQHNATPVLFMTGLPPDNALRQKVEACHMVLPKPFDEVMLNDRLRTVL